MESNIENVVGVDEVGRGCLFGPVFAGAVILNQDGENHLIKSGVKDSKSLTSRKRKALLPLIKETSLAWSIGQSSAGEIDQHGIRHATELAMIRALHKINIYIGMVLVDGILPIRIWDGPQETIVKGDNLKVSISAASIIAKEERDSLIRKLAINYPGYGLEKHVGYGTKIHIEAILNQGPTKLHRLSFISKYNK